MKCRKIGDKIIYKGLSIIFLLVLLFYAVCMAFCAVSSYNVLSIAVISAVILVSCYCLFLLSKRLFKNKNTAPCVTIIIISLLIYTFWCIYSDAQPISDYKVLIDGARAINDGTFRELSHNKEGYFYFFNFQTGYSIYLSLILKLSFGSEIGLKIAEIVVMTLTNLFLYLILKKFISSEWAFCGALFYTLFLPNIAGSSIINNQHISSLMVMLFLYFFIDKKHKASKFLSGFFLSLSYILRPSIVIIVIALMCLIIFEIFSNEEKNFKKSFLNILIALAVFGVCVFIFDTVLKLIDFVPVSAVRMNLPYFKFLLGIQGCGITGAETVDGEHTHMYFDLQKYGFDYDLYNSECKKFIIEKIMTNPKELALTYLKKTVKFIGLYDNQTDYLGKELNGNMVTAIQNTGLCQYYILTLFSMAMSITQMFRKDNNLKNNKIVILSEITFIGFFLIHIFIEAQTRYRFEQYYLLVLISFISAGNLFGSKKRT